MVLDADYRIVEFGGAVEARFGHLAGLILWDVEPAVRPLVEPYYERAWRTGEVVDFVLFFGGRLARIEAVVRADRLHVSWEVLHRIDVLTLEGLRSSLAEAMTIVERQEDRIARDRNRGRLQALEGGGS